MLFTIFFALTLSQTKICICHQKCSPQCQKEILIKTTNSTFKKLISPYIDKSNEIEIDFYYEDDKNLFELDLKDFKENKIILKNCLNSKQIKVTIKNKNSFVEQISIKPNDQLLLPKYDISNITNNNKPSFHRNVLELPDNKYDDIKGLINASCDQINYVTGFAYCSKSPGTSGGSATNGKGAKANFVFNGSRIFVVQHDQNNSNAGGVMQISIDGKVKGSSDLSTKTSGFIVVFCSEYLPFGEHTIELEQTSESGTFYINSFLVDPLPEVGGHVLGYDDIKENNGWTHDTTTNRTPFIKSLAVGATMKFKFHGTRFWLTGIRDLSYGKCNLTIDNKETVTIDGQTGVDRFNDDLKSRINGHQGVLLYESDVLEFKDHTITIEKIDGKEFRINNLMYSTQPYNAIVVPSSKAKYTGSWIPQEDGHSTTIDGSKAHITEYFNHFWIVGNKIKDNQALMNVYYNEENERTVNVSSVVSEFTKEILFASDHNIARGTYDVEVEKVRSSQEIQNEVLYINYFYYLNEKTIEAHKNAITINLVNINPRPDEWTAKDGKLFSETENAAITVEPTQFSQFWITGDVDPNYGIIDIYVNGEYQSSVSLYNEKHQEDIVIYESPKSNIIMDYKIEIRKQDGKTICIKNIQYNPYSDYGKEYDELYGLINVTCDRFNHYINYAFCYKKNANGGSYFHIGGIMNFTFNGTRVHVVSFDQNNTYSGGVMQISIDGKIVGRYCPVTRTDLFPIVFSSDYYPFGEHTIEIEHVQNDGQSFYINSILVDPLPRVGGHVLGYENISEGKEKWSLVSGKTSFFKSREKNALLKFKFHGTRFWLTGIRDDSYGRCQLFIDDEEAAIIDERTGIDKFDNSEGNYKIRANQNKGVLLYESDVLEFKDHTITIKKIDANEFCIVNLMYSTQPYNAIVVPPDEISFDEHWTQEEDGYSTSVELAQASITEFLNHVWIIGNKTPDKQALMNVYYNDKNKHTIDINSVKTEFEKEILFCSLSEVFRTYNIKLEKTSSSTESVDKILHISYLYYLNEKTITPTGTNTIISATQIPEENRIGPWEVKDDNLYTESNEASIIVNFFGNKFWIYGTTDPNYGKIDILIDDKKLGSVLLYSEKNVKNVIVYESPKGISVDEHKLEILNPKNKPISIYQFEYQVLPPTDAFSFSSEFTDSKDFTRSEKFSKSDYFSVSTHFTESDKFSVTSSFSESGKFSRSTFFSNSGYFSESEKFSRSTFFSNSGHFSESGKFSRTTFFSDSGHFSETSKFSRTNDFTQTEGFTVSSAFSPSLLPGGDVCMFQNVKGNYTKNDCRHHENEGLDDLIHVILTNFVDYIDENNGGAVYIINGGLDCESISFNHCVAKNGGGGSIYVKNTLDLVYNVTLLNVTAKDCRASYGGAGYIYIHSESNGIEIIGSAFENNTATQMKGTKESENLYGGSHFFITAHNVNVMNSYFRKGINNGGLKLYNVFDQRNKASMLDVGSQNHIFISGCNFELDEKSKNSIDYIDSHNRSKIEFVDCSFTGKLGENSHYIEGKVGSKGAENVKISSCKFEYENEKAVSIGIFSKDQFIKADNAYEKAKSFGFIPFNSFMVLFSVALVISTLILLLLKFTKGQNDYENNANLF